MQNSNTNTGNTTTKNISEWWLNSNSDFGKYTLCSFYYPNGKYYRELNDMEIEHIYNSENPTSTVRDKAKIWFTNINAVAWVKLKVKYKIQENVLSQSLNDEQIIELYLSEHPSPTANKEAEDTVHDRHYDKDGNLLDLDVPIHTPLAAEDKPLNSSVELFTQGEWIKQVVYMDSWRIVAKQDDGVKVICWELRDGYTPQKESESNARLISQAPAMLRALKRFHYQLQTHAESNAWDMEDEAAYEEAAAIINSIK